MIRQPPENVPALIAIAHNTTTQNGDVAPAGRLPVTISARVMTPIVFCASLVPWASDTIEAEPTCPRRKPRSRALPGIRRVIR